MLSKKLFNWMHKVALFAIVFASLAPSISHALAAQQGINSFAQEICTRDGQKITIQVLTTKGQQLATELSAKDVDSQPANIVHHLNHCPFCANPNINAVIEAPQAPLIALFATQAQKQAVYTQPVLQVFSILPPPAQAPPLL